MRTHKGQDLVGSLTRSRVGAHAVERTLKVSPGWNAATMICSIPATTVFACVHVEGGGSQGRKASDAPGCETGFGPGAADDFRPLALQIFEQDSIIIREVVSD